MRREKKLEETKQNKQIMKNQKNSKNQQKAEQRNQSYVTLRMSNWKPQKERRDWHSRNS